MSNNLIQSVSDANPTVARVAFEILHKFSFHTERDDYWHEVSYEALTEHESVRDQWKEDFEMFAFAAARHRPPERPKPAPQRICDLLKPNGIDATWEDKHRNGGMSVLIRCHRREQCKTL